jgi:hypothetical protein
MPELLLLLQIIPALLPAFEDIVPIIEAAINGTPPSASDITTIVAARQALEAQAQAGA